MSSSNYHNVLLIDDIWGLIYGLKDLKESKSTLIVSLQAKDQAGLSERVFLSKLDLLAVNKFLSDYDVDLFKYTKEIKSLLLFNDKMLHLSSSPYDNLQELMRKLEITQTLNIPYSKEEFDSFYQSYIEEICDFQIRGEDLSEQIYAVLRRHYKVYECLRVVTEALEAKEKEISVLFQGLLQTLSSRSFSNEISNPELIYHLSSALCGGLELQVDLLQKQLFFILKSNEVTYEVSSSVKFKDKALLLDSRLVDYKKFINLSSFKRDSSELELNFDLHKALEVKTLLVESEKYNYQDTRILVMSSGSFGGNLPLSELFVTKDSATLNYYYRVCDGDKEEFYEKQSLVKSLELLGQLKIVDDKSYFHDNSSVDPSSLTLNMYSTGQVSRTSKYYMGRNSFIQSLYR